MALVDNSVNNTPVSYEAPIFTRWKRDPSNLPYGLTDDDLKAL
jgi:hypothetical protein